VDWRSIQIERVPASKVTCKRLQRQSAAGAKVGMVFAHRKPAIVMLRRLSKR
jgi:hypothetical protein